MTREERRERDQMTDEYIAMEERLDAMEEECTNLRDERDRLLEALTPSAETKAAYMGEFVFWIVDRTVNVPWITIKEIMRAIRDRAELQEVGDE